MNNKDKSHSDKIKELFRQRLNKENVDEPKKEDSNKKDSLNTMLLLIGSIFFIVRVIFIYIGYFLLHKNLNFPLYFNFLDFLLICFGCINVIGLIKITIKK